MAKEAQSTGYIRGGRLYIRDEYFDLKDGEVFVTITAERAGPSRKADGYYFGKIIKELCKHTGYTPKEMHEILKAMFLPFFVEIPTKQGAIVAELKIGGSTRSLDGVEFYDYCQTIRQWALSELNVWIEEADPNWRTNEPAEEGAGDALK